MSTCVRLSLALLWYHVPFIHSIPNGMGVVCLQRGTPEGEPDAEAETREKGSSIPKKKSEESREEERAKQE